MKITSETPIFNFINNGFMYLCSMEDGSYWVRSVSGKWVEIKTSQPFAIEILQKDFDTFVAQGAPTTENDVKVDNASQIVVDPVPVSAQAEIVNP